MSGTGPLSPPLKHQPTPFLSYVDTHLTVMAHLRRTEFVGEDRLHIDRVGSQVSIAGQIGCKGCIVVDVTKDLVCEGDVDDPNPLVQTTSYSYDVLIQGHGNILRFDNFEHVPLPAGHRDRHHAHVFLWPPIKDADGERIWVGADNWPTLGEVLFAALEWHAGGYSYLAALGIDPEAYPA